MAELKDRLRVDLTTAMKSQAARIVPVLQNASQAHPNLDIQKVAREAIVAIQKK